MSKCARGLDTPSSGLQSHIPDKPLFSSLDSLLMDIKSARKSALVSDSLDYATTDSITDSQVALG